VAHLLSGANESTPRQHAPASLVIDFPTTVPFAPWCAYGSNPLLGLLLNEQETRLSAANVPAQCPRHRHSKEQDAHTGFSCNPYSPIVKIYLLDPHRAKLTGTATGPVEYFQQSSFVIRARSAEEFIHLFLCEYMWDVSL